MKQNNFQAHTMASMLKSQNSAKKREQFHSQVKLSQQYLTSSQSLVGSSGTVSNKNSGPIGSNVFSPKGPAYHKPQKTSWTNSDLPSTSIDTVVVPSLNLTKLTTPTGVSNYQTLHRKQSQ